MSFHDETMPEDVSDREAFMLERHEPVCCVGYPMDDEGQCTRQDCTAYSDEVYRMAQAYGEAPLDPDDGYYYSGTGEWSGDDSYIDYLNNS